MGSWLEIQSLQRRVNWSAFGKYGGSLWLWKTHAWARTHTDKTVNLTQYYCSVCACSAILWGVLACTYLCQSTTLKFLATFLGTLSQPFLSSDGKNSWLRKLIRPLMQHTHALTHKFTGWISGQPPVSYTPFTHHRLSLPPISTMLLSTDISQYFAIWWWSWQNVYVKDKSKICAHRHVHTEKTYTHRDERITLGRGYACGIWHSV